MTGFLKILFLLLTLETTDKMMEDSFELLYSGKANNVVPVYKYRSQNTGLRIVIAQVEGPLVNGYFCLATEAHDDDGLPHTLEHLVFMGSEKYPYKGVLDLLANRCLASGTNAWTDTDHTCYTMTTAGSEGFLNLLPIYLDHVLYPTLTNAGYTTEVHHINGEGEDAGVVYCEMQARENTGESRTHLAMLRAMYPGHCGYKSETGGMLENLRTSTSHKKVTDYHQTFYRPENLYLIITGQVTPEEVFAAVKNFEDKIVAKGSRAPYERPWRSDVPPLPSSVEQIVTYPADEEDHGMVCVAWRGPKAKEQYTLSAVLMIMEYLTDTAVAPMQRDFVEIEDPYCSSVHYSIIENSESSVYFRFQNVPKAKVNQVKDKLIELLQKMASGAEQIDMTRMHSVVHRRVLEAMSALEDQPHDTIAFHVIGEFLYADTKEEMDERLNQIDSFRKLDKEPQEFWTNLLNSYFVDKNSVTIIGEPSKKLMEEMGSTEKERVKKQQESLGEKGLKENNDILEKATEENDREPPENVITSVSVPDVGSIHFHTIKASSNRDSSAASSAAKFPLADIPVTTQLDDIQTNFVSLYVLMDSGSVPSDLRLYLPLYVEAILESPVLRNGVLVSHEDIITELAADTVYNGASLGLGGSRFSCGNFGQLVSLMLKVEVEKYAKGVKWLRELLYQVQFSVDRLKIIILKMVNDVARMKRNGRTVAQTLMRNVLFTKDSNFCKSSMLRQHKFLTGILQKIEKGDTAQQVISDLKKLQAILTRPSNLWIHIAASVDPLATLMGGSPQKVWMEDFLPKDVKVEGEKPVVQRSQEFLLPMNEGESRNVIVGVGSVESAYLILTTPCVSDFNHEDLPAIMIYIQYLTQLEGPMWRQIRGLGLSYHYSMYVKPESGLLYFILFKSTHVVNALKQAKDILDGYISGRTAYSEVELESSKSSLIFEIIEEEKTPADASSESLLSYFRGVDRDYNRQIIQKISLVTVDDLKRVGPKYIQPLLDVTKSSSATCCHPTKVQEVVKGFKELGRDLKVLDSLENPMLTEP